MQRKGLEPDLITYNDISVCERARWSEITIELLETMRHAGLESDIITYSLVPKLSQDWTVTGKKLNSSIADSNGACVCTWRICARKMHR